MRAERWTPMMLCLLVTGGCGGDDRLPAPIEPGAAEVLLERVLSTEGGVLQVDRPGHALHGLRVEVPAGAYDAPGTWTLSSRAVRTRDVPEGVRLMHPGVQVVGPPLDAASPVLLQLPARTAEGQFAMAFRLDEATGALDALPLLDHDGTTVSVAMQRFSTVLVATVDQALLEHGEIGCSFDPVRDVWQVPNQATYVSPMGTCEGLSSTAVWYFHARRLAGEPHLHGRFDNDRVPNTPTPDLWQDDVLALKVAATAQADAYPYLEDIWPRWERMQAERKDGRSLDGAQIQFYAAAHALLTAKRPVLLGLRERALEPGGHMVVAYRATPRTLHVVDPNFPGRKELTVSLLPPDPAHGHWRFEPYLSGRTAQDSEAGRERSYKVALCLGTLPPVRRERLEALWTALAETRGGSMFPDVSLYARIVDDGDASPRRVALEPGGVLRVRQQHLEVEVEAPPTTVTGQVRALSDRVVSEGNRLPFIGRVRICRFEDRKTFHAGRIALEPGENHLGCLVEGRLGDGYYWADFAWVRVEREPVSESESRRASRGSVTFADDGGRNQIRIDVEDGGPLSVRDVPQEAAKPPLKEVVHHLGPGYRLKGRLTVEGSAVAEWTLNLWDPTALQRHRIRDPVGYMRDGGLEQGEYYSVRIFSDEPDGGGVVLFRLASASAAR